MDEQENANDQTVDKDVDHETLNKVDAQESDVNKISITLQDDWRAFDN